MIIRFHQTPETLMANPPGLKPGTKPSEGIVIFNFTTG